MTDKNNGRPKANVGIYVGGVVALSLLGVTALVLVNFTRPDKDNAAINTMIVGFLVPTIGILAMAAIQTVAKAVDGRVQELLDATHEAALQKGILEEKAAQRERAQVVAAEVKAVATEAARVLNVAEKAKSGRIVLPIEVVSPAGSPSSISSGPTKPSSGQPQFCSPSLS